MKKGIDFKISVSRFNIGRITENLSNNTAEKFKEKAAYFQWFSLSLDESTDVTQLNLLPLFAEIDIEFNLTGELAGLMTMKGTVKISIMKSRKCRKSLIFQFYGRKEQWLARAYNQRREKYNRPRFVYRCLMH
jgi:hypothetical protein